MFLALGTSALNSQRELVMSQLANVRTTQEVNKEQAPRTQKVAIVRDVSVAVSHDQGCD